MNHPNQSAHTSKRRTFAFSLSFFPFHDLLRLGMVRHDAQKRRLASFLFFFLLLLLLLQLMLRVRRSEGGHGA
jgi:hypothetical protein